MSVDNSLNGSTNWNS